ncbi:hypothetical protein, partial [Serratia marcescens]|uniref:hypothetical protein n=1 Tax=Serratia marcescens TaxID=615 RepID=UPI003989E234
IGLLIVSLIILCGCILLTEHLLRCVSWSRLGINDCFVLGADIANVYLHNLWGADQGRLGCAGG